MKYIIISIISLIINTKSSGDELNELDEIFFSRNINIITVNH
jgi:hypothetical protein